MRYLPAVSILLVLGCDPKSTADTAAKPDAKAEKSADSAAPADKKEAKADAPKSDAVIKFNKIEDTIPVTDTGVKFNISLTGTKGPKVTSATATLTAVYKDGAAEKSVELATETDDGSSWSAEDNPFPGEVGGDWDFAGSVFMDDDKNKQLQTLFAAKDANGLKLMLKVELASTGGAIAPVEHEITLQ